jgi:hypothetical protein
MRENHPRRRQARRLEGKLVRARASRQGLPVMLVVCEGTQTEPNYLRGLCEARRINAANVRIESGGSATDVLSLVKKARAQFLKNRDYDFVYVVFDDDGQPIEEARRLSESPLKTLSGKTISVQLIVNRPAFEFWLLLHFEYSARPFATGGEVIEALRAHLTDFHKADRRIFQQVSAGFEGAMANAQRLRQELERTDAMSPGTDMDVLASQLLTMARAEIRV